VTFINTTTTKVLLTTLGAAALLFAGTTTASAHMSTTTSTNTTPTTQVSTPAPTTNRTTSTGVQNTSYAHTTANTSTTTSTATTTANTSGAVAKALAVANSGVPYVFGGSSMSGFDCSGLVQYAFGLSARTTYQQTNLGTHHYDVANAPAGAILFWGSDSAPYHDGISLGNGKYVAAQNESDGIGVFSQTYWPASFYITVN